MKTLDKKIEIDGVETAFSLRKPTFGDTIAAFESAGIPMDSMTGKPKASAAQFMRLALFRVSRCIVTPKEYSDVKKLEELPESAAQELIGALDELSAPSPNFSKPSDAPSEQVG